MRYKNKGDIENYAYLSTSEGELPIWSKDQEDIDFVIIYPNNKNTCGRGINLTHFGKTQWTDKSETLFPRGTKEQVIAFTDNQGITLNIIKSHFFLANLYNSSQNFAIMKKLHNY